MTAQCTEFLHFQGETLSLCTNPLGDYLEAAGSPLKFYSTSTACWRGYVGTWAIEGGRLYLVKLNGCVRTASGIADVNLASLFPDYPDGVFAHWFTGQLRCPKGALLKYVHGGYSSSYEQDLLIDVQRGVVVQERLAVNGAAEPGAKPGYAMAGFTLFGRDQDV